MPINDTLRKVTESWEMEPVEINDGYCMDWAADAKELVGGEVVEIDRNGNVVGPSCGQHFVLALDGRYYDAERPKGVRDAANLPWVTRNTEYPRN